MKDHAGLDKLIGSDGGAGYSHAVTTAPIPPSSNSHARTTEAHLHMSIANHMREVLRLVGMDVDDASVKDTPMRFAKMLVSYNTPFNAEKLLTRSFQTTDATSVVAQSRIPFTMLCEHHLMPAIGHAYVAYLPHKGVVVGLSKLARLVKAVGRERPSLQEAINDRVANLLIEHLEPKGVMVIIKAEHTCMTCRGADAPGVATTTSIVKGAFRDVAHLRQEAMDLFKL